MCAYYKTATPTIAKIWRTSALQIGQSFMSLHSHHTYKDVCASSKFSCCSTNHYSGHASKKSDGHSYLSATDASPKIHNHGSTHLGS